MSSRSLQRWTRGIVPVAIGLLLSLASATGAAQGLDERLLQLEQQVRALTSRIEALEGGTAAQAQDGQVASDGAVVWTFDDYVGRSPFRVAYREIDPQQGRVELLLEITAPLADSEHWRAVGGQVPIGVRLRAADGKQTEQAFRLRRGGRLDPGAYLHLEASVDPARAAATRQLIVGRTSGEPQGSVRP